MLADQILHFSEFFLGLFRWVQKFNGLNIAIFVKYLINSKKIQKNVKFDLQVTLNISIILNGLDRLFGLWNFENGHCHTMSPKKWCNPIPPHLYYPYIMSIKSNEIWYMFNDIDASSNHTYLYF